VSRALAGALVLLAAAPAGARKFQMSGEWILRQGSVFIPLQFATAIWDTGPGSPVVHQSMGDLTGAFGFPNGPIPGAGGVTATGSAPATLRIAPHRFGTEPMFAVGLTSSLVQITTSFGVDAPHAAATLAPGGGPGSFTWCPDDAACAALGGTRTADPPQGAGARNGRVVYRSGANQFGGAMQLGLRRGGSTGFVYGVLPYRVGYRRFGGAGITLRPRAEGGLGSADAPTAQTVFLPRGVVTQPTMLPATPFELVLYPGPKVTTMQGLTTSGTGATLYLPATPVAIGPMGTLAAQVTTQHGFANTTGTVIVQQTEGTGGQDFFTVMGSDARTPLGAGNLSLVAGALSFRNTLAWQTPHASFQKISLTLAPPIPSLSPAGAAAAAALMLLAVGYVLRRRGAAR
jgi:hypothetical protein